MTTVTNILVACVVIKHRHYRHALTPIKVFAGCRWLFSKDSPWSRLSARSVLLPTEVDRGRHRRPAPLGERKTCLQVAFLMGSPVKSAFALLLTRVTEPRPHKFRIARNLASLLSHSLHCSSSRQKVTLRYQLFAVSKLIC